MTDIKTPTKNPKFDPCQLIVVFKESADAKACDCLLRETEEIVKKKHPDFGTVKIERFHDGVYKNVELWKHQTEIVIDMAREHVGQNSTNVDFIIYNHPNGFPEIFDLDASKDQINYEKMDIDPSQLNGNEEVVIAVLDTGVDTSIIPEQYLWQGEVEGKMVNGVNFIVDEDDENSEGDKNISKNKRYNIHDDNFASHGTLVNAFIIEQFKGSGKKVKIMNLKTHDKGGKGNLFSALSAIRFAKQNNAHIINASWGFYSQEDDTLEPLKKLIINTLRDMGVLFVAASGNLSEVDDDYFLSNFPYRKGEIRNPRNLSQHHFYPAFFGNQIEDESKSMFVVTTIKNYPKSFEISPRQNFSPEVVDLGILADDLGNNKKINDDFNFKVPLKEKDKTSPSFISGSSFAAAIATGKIGSHYPSALLLGEREGKVNKKNLLDDKIGLGIFRKDPKLAGWIKNGLYLY